jgi:hypothetical protein
MNNTVIEFKYDSENKQWIPYRYRRDKTATFKRETVRGPNSYAYAQDIYEIIQNPVTLAQIMGLTDEEVAKIMAERKASGYYAEGVSTTANKSRTVSLRKFHNNIKLNLYKDYLKRGANILELASGRGGDIPKLQRQNVNYALLIDVDAEGVKEASNSIKYLSSSQNSKNKKTQTQQFDFAVGNASTDLTTEIKTHMEQNNIKAFDMVSIQFAFHYFFKNKETFANIFKNIDTYLASGGYFIATFLDGNTIFELLKKQNSITNKNNATNTTNATNAKNTSTQPLYKIEKKYAASKKKIADFGTTVSVLFETIGEHDEYLINIDFVTDYFTEHGYKVVDTAMFDTKLDKWQQNRSDMQLSEVEQKYTKLNRYLVLQKI